MKDLTERVGSGEVQVHWLRLIGQLHTDATHNKVYPIIETTQQPPTQTTLQQWEQEGNRIVLKTAWRARAVRFYWTAYSVEVQLACSEAPVSVPELDAYLSFLEGWFLSHRWDFWSIDWRATNFALNVDTTTIRLDGVEAVTLQSLKGEVRRWYTKHGITGEPVRREVHVAGPGVPVRALVQELVANLAGERPVGTTTLAHEVTALTEIQRDQGREMRRLRSLGDRLLLELRRIRPEGAAASWGRTKPRRKNGRE